jgi:uncharacterized Zn-finger protein
MYCAVDCLHAIVIIRLKARSPSNPAQAKIRSSAAFGPVEGAIKIWSASMTIKPSETITVTEPVIACDGGDGALGHPRVYLHMNETGEVECPYCDRLYVLDQSARKSAVGH